MQPDRTTELASLLAQRILVMDGAMGTMIQGYKLGEGDYRGACFAVHSHDLKGDKDLLSLTRPDVVEKIHRAYLEAGADLVETNTFNANAVSQAAYAMQALCYRIPSAISRRSRKSRSTTWTPPRPRVKPSGSPGTPAPSSCGSSTKSRTAPGNDDPGAGLPLQAVNRHCATVPVRDYVVNAARAA